MAEFNENEISDLSQVSNQLKQSANKAKQAASTAKNTAQKTASGVKKGVSKAHDILEKKRKNKGLRKKKKKKEKKAKRIRRIRRAFCSIISTIGGVVVVILLVFGLIIAVFTTVVSAISGGSVDESKSGGGFTIAGGGEQAFVEFAHQQLGNPCTQYCREMGYPETQWCAIYAGWLLREGAGVDLDEYGWSAGCGMWCDALKAKGLYYETNKGYIPSIGDVMFKGTSQTNRTHVGIVIGVEDGQIITSEGNAWDAPYWNHEVNVVTEKRYDINWDSGYGKKIVGYGHIPIEFATGGYTPRLTEFAHSSKFYNSNENTFQAAGYGILQNGGNCTAYAWGRAYEILGTKPKLSTASARYWYEENKSTKAYPYGKTPKVGAILCLSDNGNGAGGHVAVVEKVNSDGSIVTSESGWQSYIFKTVTRYKSNNYTPSSAYSFQGFIYIYSGEETGSVSYKPVSGLSTNEAKTYYYFKSKGFNNAAICGLMANIMMECSFDTSTFTRQCDDVLNPYLKASGICMWTAEGFENFKRDCPTWKQGIDGQLVYLYETIVKNDKSTLPNNQKYTYWCNGVYTMLKTTPNTESGARAAALNFCANYERPAPGSESTRASFASGYWSKVKNLK